MSDTAWRNRIVGYADVAPDQLLANDQNWRGHPQHQQDVLTGTLNEIGWLQDVIVNKRTSELWPPNDRNVETMLDGHLRVMLAMRHNQPSVPIKYVDLTPDEERLALLTFDPISALAFSDAGKLDALLKETQSENAAVNKLLADLAHDAGLTRDEETADAEAQIDRAAELNKVWQVKTGDLWFIGDHRLLCGDSTRREYVVRLLNGDLAQLVFTDPPYGVDYDGGTTVREKLSGDDTTELYMPCCKMSYDFSDEHAALYLWHAGIKGIAAAAAAAAAGYEIRCEIVWNKNQAQFGALSAQYKQKHEPCYYCYKKGKTVRWFGETNEVTVWDIDRSSVNEFHPTQKPIGLAAKAIINNSSVGDIVADWFAGSGSTGIACQNLNRKARMIEISPNYCAVILQRFKDAFPSLDIHRAE